MVAQDNECNLAQNKLNLWHRTLNLTKIKKGTKKGPFVFKYSNDKGLFVFLTFEYQRKRN